VRNPYIDALERRMKLNMSSGECIDVSKALDGLLKELQKIDRKFSLPVVSKLLKIASQCEAGGHKGRGRMFRALAKEFEVKLESEI
jgi:hypothetical protein